MSITFIKSLSNIKIIRKIIFIISYPILNFNKSLKDQQKFILKVLFLAMLTLITNYSFNVLLNVAPPSLILLVLIVFSALYCNIFLIFIILQIMFGISKQYALLNKNSNSGWGGASAAAGGPGGIAQSHPNNIKISYFITNFHSFLISTLTLLILFFILKPSLLLNSTQLLSLSIFNC